MLVLGLDGIDHDTLRSAVPAPDVEPLVNDLGTLHTVPSWTAMFSVGTTPRERPSSYNEPIADDFIWDENPGTFTLANVPVTFPTQDRHCDVHHNLSLPANPEERAEERRVLSEIVQTAETDHTIAVLNGVDKLQHVEDDRQRVERAYRRAWRWAMAHAPDVVLSDHGFETLGGREAHDDHGPTGIVHGLGVGRVSDASDALCSRLGVD